MSATQQCMIIHSLKSASFRFFWFVDEKPSYQFLSETKYPKDKTQFDKCCVIYIYAT